MSSPQEQKQKQIIILGAGITGLQTALSLLTSPGTSPHKITIIASHTPGDSAPSYSSPWAGGHWRSHASSSDEDEEVRGWDKRTYEFWSALLEGKTEEEAKEIGLGFKESRNFWGTASPETTANGSGLWWKSLVSAFKVLDLLAEKDVPPGAVYGISYRSICINVPVYLKYLFSRVNMLGGVIVKMDPGLTTTAGLAGVISPAKQILGMAQDRDVEDDEILAVVNCTGLTAREFASDEEKERLYPIRGQTILVKGEANLARTFTDFGISDEIAYVIPRPGSGTTILGGCKQEGNGSSEVDEELSKRILGRMEEWGLAEELRTGEGGKFEVLSTQVGFRPGRTGGPRVEVEGGKVEGVSVVHSYGHAGAGYQNSMGSAEKVVKLIEGLI